MAKIEEAGPGSLCFISNSKYEEYLYTSNASVILVNESLEITKPVTPTLIKVQDAYSSFAMLLDKYNEMVAGQDKTGIEQPCYISSTAKIPNDVYVRALLVLSVSMPTLLEKA